MSERLFEIEHRPGEELVLRFKSPKVRGLPPTMGSHTRAAVKEGLLAVRSLFDAAIERIERAGEPKERTKVEVE